MSFYATIFTFLLVVNKLGLLFFGRMYINEFKLGADGVDNQILKCKNSGDQFYIVDMMGLIYVALTALQLILTAE